MNDCYWSLYNQKDRSRFDGLRTIQARAIVKSIPPAHVRHWLAWKEGTPEWRPLTEHLETLLRVERPIETSIAAGGELATVQNSVGVRKAQTNQVDQDFSDLTPSSRRLAVIKLEADQLAGRQNQRQTQRYPLTLEVIVEFHGGRLQTQTDNLSLGGCKLKAALPKDIQKRHATATLINGRSRVEAVCEIIFEKDGRAPTRLRFLDVARLDLLRTWMLEIA